MPPERDIRVLQRNKNKLLSSLNRFKDFLDAIDPTNAVDNKTVLAIEARLKLCDSYLQEFATVQNDLFELDEEINDAEDAEFEDLYLDVVATANSIIQQTHDPGNNSQTEQDDKDKTTTHRSTAIHW